MISDKPCEQVVLCHGSNLEIGNPLLSESTAEHPGGRGFFTVNNRLVATKFAIEKARRGGVAVVNAYALRDDGCLRILELSGSTPESARQIDLCTHSAEPSETAKSDFAAGCDLIVVHNIRPGSKTYIFKTDHALQCLTFSGCQRLFLNGFFHRIFWAIANPVNNLKTVRTIRQKLHASTNSQLKRNKIESD